MSEADDATSLLELILRFRTLSIYREISNGYDDCFYTWEINGIRNRSMTEETLCARLKEHCVFVLNQLKAMSDTGD